MNAGIGNASDAVKSVLYTGKEMKLDFKYGPGNPILHSRDLVNCKPANGSESSFNMIFYCQYP
jgi:hypothetical protein